MRAIEETLQECGAILRGHFLLSSKIPVRHSDQYIEKAEICANPVVIANLCWKMANEVSSQFNTFGGNRIQIVVGLAPIGAVLASRVAEYLGDIYQEDVISVFTEKNKEGGMVFMRGYAQKITDKKALIVDDALTTGTSVGLVKKEIYQLGGEVIGVAVICQRGEVRSRDLTGTPILSLVELKMKDWPPGECPLCREGIPLTNPKSR